MTHGAHDGPRSQQELQSPIEINFLSWCSERGVPWQTAQADWHTITAAAAQQVYKMSNGVKRTERFRKPLK